jgi:hypothetical protein
MIKAKQVLSLQGRAEWVPIGSIDWAEIHCDDSSSSTPFTSQQYGLSEFFDESTLSGFMINANIITANWDTTKGIYAYPVPTSVGGNLGTLAPATKVQIKNEAGESVYLQNTATSDLIMLYGYAWYAADNDLVSVTLAFIDSAGAERTLTSLNTLVGTFTVDSVDYTMQNWANSDGMIIRFCETIDFDEILPTDVVQLGEHIDQLILTPDTNTFEITHQTSGTFVTVTTFEVTIDAGEALSSTDVPSDNLRVSINGVDESDKVFDISAVSGTPITITMDGLTYDLEGSDVINVVWDSIIG